jgi:hypothetical protein
MFEAAGYSVSKRLLLHQLPDKLPAAAEAAAAVEVAAPQVAGGGQPAAGFVMHLLLLVCAFCAGVSGNLFDTAALVTNVQNFPNDR